MRARRWVVGLALLAGAVTVTGCSTSGGSGPTTTTGSVPAGPTSTTPVPATSSTASTAQAVDVPVTPQVRTQLLAAVAALDSIPVAQFSGLAPGLTYLALDRATHTYWAGARAVAAPSADPSTPTQAQVSTQDEGSYYVFSQPQGGTWTAHAAGNVGPDTPCPVVVPPAVTAVWGWPAGSCRPAGV